MITTILFDLDGTLIDSEPLSVRAMLESLQNWGTPLPPEKIPHVVGLKWEEAERRLRQWIEIPLRGEEALEVFRKRYRELTAKALIEVPGAVACVKNLAQHYPMALVSGSHRDEIAFALSKLGVADCFKFILGAEDYPRSKPAPDGYLMAIETLCVSPTETLIFEDSEAGVHSGKNAGARVVAIDCTNHYHHDTSRADFHVENLEGIDTNWIKKLG